MLILALDSTAVVGSVALCKDETPIAHFTLKNGNTHSETLLPMIESVLRVADCTINDIDLFACSVGPGSFTGVRIGAATVKGLAFGQNKPCAAVSTLEALAQNLAPLAGVYCPVMNARRGQVYQAFFRCVDNQLTRLCPDRAISIADLETELAQLQEPFLLCGDGADLVKESLVHATPVDTPPLLLDQNAVSVAICAYRAFIRGETVSDAELAPTYLRLPQAERERLARLAQQERNT